MLTNTKQQKREKGQTVVIFALAIVGLIAFVGLAVDGGNVLNERRITQNAADASALRGVHYLTASDGPTETGLLQVINGIVEANGIPDTDGNLGNEINDNVTIYYTSAEGNRITGACNMAPCSADPDDSPPPPEARGVEVILDNQVDTYFMGVIGLNTVDIGGRAVAVTTDNSNNPDIDLGDNALIAFGTCPKSEGPGAGDRQFPLDVSASGVEFIGGLYSRSEFYNTGTENHYHAPVYYNKDDGGFPQVPGSPAEYYAGPPISTTVVISDPFKSLFDVNDFACELDSDGADSGGIGSQYAKAGECFDLRDAAAANVCKDKGEIFNCIDTKLLKDLNLLYEYTDPLTGQTHPKLETGIYYGGQYPFYNIGDVISYTEGVSTTIHGMIGKVTIVSDSFIKMGTEADPQLEGFMPQGSVLPGLLMYSAFNPKDPETGEDLRCANHQDLVKNKASFPPINTTGSFATSYPQVHHDACNNIVEDWASSTCVEPSTAFYKGILYAPNGRISTSGDGITYQGAVIGYTIRVNGFADFDREADKVGALFIHDAALLNSDTTEYIFLDE